MMGNSSRKPFLTFPRWESQLPPNLSHFRNDHSENIMAFFNEVTFEFPTEIIIISTCTALIVSRNTLTGLSPC